MASLATITEQEQQIDLNHSVPYTAWDKASRVPSTWFNYRDDNKENGTLAEIDKCAADEDINSEISPHTDSVVVHPEYFVAEAAHQNNNNGGSSSSTGNTTAGAYSDDSQNIQGENFLEKLSELRMAHKKTLVSWQKLYEKNVSKNPEKKSKKPSAKPSSSSSLCSGGQYPMKIVDLEYNEKDPIENIHCGLRYPVDNNPHPRSNANVYHKISSPRKPKSSPPHSTNYNVINNNTRSFIKPAWADHNELKSFTSSNTGNFAAASNSDKSSSSDFSDTNRKFDACKHSEVDKFCDGGEWHYKLTIPEPFNMTLRDEGNPKKKSRSLLEYEKECEEKRKFEEEECKKMFKATPVPGHVFMPIYEDLRKKEELRRSLMKEQMRDFLRMRERPYSFDTKGYCDKEELEEEYRKMFSQEKKVTKKKKHPKPIPVTKNVLDSSIDEKMKEDANRREMRRKLRSYEMLKSASIPRGMELRQNLMEQKMKSKNKETDKKKHYPKLYITLPDYDALYRKFQKELRKKRKVIENTSVQPFTFHTSELFKQRERKKRMQQAQYDSDEGLNRLRRSTSFPDYLHTIPAKMTTSAELRTQANRDKITKFKNSSKDSEKLPKTKDNYLKKEIQMKISAYGQKNKNQKSTPKYREQQRNYTRQLQEMRERLEKRPLLFEQVEKNNVKNRAERKFRDTLRDFGLDESFVSEEYLNKQPSYPRAISVDYPSESNDIDNDNKNYNRRNSYSELKYEEDLDEQQSPRTSHNSTYSPESGSDISDNEEEATV